MTAVELLCIGRELLTGRTADRNGPWLLRRVTGLGGRVTRLAILDDDPTAIAAEIRTSLARSPAFLLTTGGLGPTADDRTAAALAEALGVPLALDATARRFVAARYAALEKAGAVADAALSSSREKMAWLPVGAEALENPVGAAPAIRCHHPPTTVVALPGVPAEMQACFDAHLASPLAAAAGWPVLLAGEVRTDCADESVLAPLLEVVRQEFPDLYVKSRPAAFGREVRLAVTVSGAGKEAEALAARLEAALARLRGLLRGGATRPPGGG
ncbi:MAG: competence/damage-inducible protein A [candidate division NC10 bacterium]|nr:competence/damage-inducible protein A [candidate division NC10 bacterium]